MTRIKEIIKPKFIKFLFFRYVLFILLIILEYIIIFVIRSLILKKSIDDLLFIILNPIILGVLLGTTIGIIPLYKHLYLEIDKRSMRITGPGFWWGRDTILFSTLLNKEYKTRKLFSKLLLPYMLISSDGKSIYIDENIYPQIIIPYILSIVERNNRTLGTTPNDSRVEPT